MSSDRNPSAYIPFDDSEPDESDAFEQRVEAVKHNPIDEELLRRYMVEAGIRASSKEEKKLVRQEKARQAAMEALMKHSLGTWGVDPQSLVNPMPAAPTPWAGPRSSAPNLVPTPKVSVYQRINTFPSSAASPSAAAANPPSVATATSPQVERYEAMNGTALTNNGSLVSYEDYDKLLKKYESERWSHMLKAIDLTDARNEIQRLHDQNSKLSAQLDSFRESIDKYAAKTEQLHEDNQDLCETLFSTTITEHIGDPVSGQPDQLRILEVSKSPIDKGHKITIKAEWYRPSGLS